MKKIIFSILVLYGFSFAKQPAISDSVAQIDFNASKYALLNQAEQNQQEEIEQTVHQKSVLTAAMLSAVVPGAGEAYAGSYWKAAIFAGLEVAFWSANFVYNRKGKEEDTDMRAYGDAHWSERRYWSNVYRVVKDEAEWTGGTLVVDADGILTDNSYTAADIDALRPMESVAGFTHSLPTTKTQQYYEMIYKYLHQFGVGWDDVEDDFGTPYFYDVPDNWRYPTSNALEYRDMRDLSNHYYDVAGNMVMLAMVNHLVSLFDAAYTVKKQNQKINYSFRIKPQFIGSGYQNTYGLNIIW